ncbi:MAG: hypothetical protein GY803_10825 [Chloroflexi bacterium]|nr:hypothetical protein [Chloroflexota bacterium]
MKEIEWATVTETNGITIAEMLAQRLKGAEIPAFAVQESAGKAYGLSIGPMSVAYVRVPVEYLEEARLLLDASESIDEDDIVTCPHCNNDIELDEMEWEQGWYNCPVCAEQVSIG